MIELTEFFNATDMATIAGSSAEPRIESVEGHLWSDESRTETQNIGVIVLARQAGRGGVVDESGTHTRDFVGGNGDTDSRTTDRHSEFGRAVGHRVTHGGAVVGIVDRRDAVFWAEVHDVVTALSKRCGHQGLEVVPRVVGAKGDAHCPHATRHPCRFG